MINKVIEKLDQITKSLLMIDKHLNPAKYHFPSRMLYVYNIYSYKINRYI